MLFSYTRQSSNSLPRLHAEPRKIPFHDPSLFLILHLLFYRIFQNFITNYDHIPTFMLF